MATIRKHAPQGKLRWATITPMRQAGKLDVIAENTKRVQARNQIAEAIVAREGIAVDDLYGLVKDHPETWSPGRPIQRRCPRTWNSTILSVAASAYQRKTGQEFEHLTPLSYETYSNREGWPS